MMKERAARELLVAGTGALVALVLFAWLLAGRSMTFMADDFAHLLATRTRTDLFTGYFGDWFARVPVWAVATWGLFASRWLEASWHAAILAFGLHAVGLAWLSAALLRIFPTDKPVPWAGGALAVAALALYSNVYEILFWPTCMAYSLGSVCLGFGAWVRRPWVQAAAFAMAGLTYETFLLPALCVLLLPILQARPDGRLRCAVRACAIWGASMLAVLCVRGGFARVRGAFPHLTNYAPSHVLAHMGESFALLLRMRHYQMHTALAASVGLVVLAALTLGVVRPDARRTGGVLLVGTYVSTGLFWVLNYGAVRAVYGAQLLLCAALVWLVCHAMVRAGILAPLAMCGLALLGGLFLRHHGELLGVKDRNAAVMADVELRWSEMLRDCTEPCHLVYGDLRGHLEPDWVWPPNYQPVYMAWLKQKYAPERAVTFEFVQTPTQGYRRLHL